jgi:anoctamin-10
LPTILLTVFNPTLTTLLTKLAERLTEMENYETQDGKWPGSDHESAG